MVNTIGIYLTNLTSVLRIGKTQFFDRSGRLYQYFLINKTLYKIDTDCSRFSTSKTQGFKSVSYVCVLFAIYIKIISTLK